MKPNPWQRALALLISFCFLATSCTTTRVTQFPNEQTPNATPNLSVGDTVKVTFRTGAIKTFKVTAINAQGLTGRNLSVPYKDMLFLEVKKVSGWRTAGLGVGVVLVAGLVWIYSLIRSHRYDD